MPLILILFLFFLPLNSWAKPLKVGLYPLPPLAYVDGAGKPNGLFVEFLEHLAEEEHWDLVYHIGSQAEIQAKLEAGQLDLGLAFAYSPELAQRLAFGKEFLVADWGAIYTRPAHALSGLMDLQGMTIAGVQGDFHLQQVKQAALQFPQAPSFVEKSTLLEVFAAVSSGEAQAGVASRFAGEPWATQHMLTPAPFHLAELAFGFVAPQGQGKLLHELDEEIAQSKSGQGNLWEQLEHHRLVKRSHSFLTPFRLMGFFGFLVLLFLLLSLLLKSQVKQRTAELKDAKEGLEKAVSLRTQELTSEVVARKSAQGNLDLALKEMEGILENVPVAIIFEKNGIVSRTNKAMERLADVPRSQIVGREAMLPLVHAEDRKTLAKAVSQLRQTGGFAAEFASYRGASRESIWVRIKGVPLVGPEAHSLWILEDVTEHRQWEQSLIRSEAKFRNMFENHRAMMILEELETGRILDANPAVLEFFGYSKEVLLQKRLTEIAVGWDQAEACSSKEAGGKHGCNQMEVTLATGETKALESRSVQFEWEGKPIMFSILFDVTARKRFEQEIQETSAALTRLNKTLENRVKEEVDARLGHEKLLLQQSKMASMGELLSMIAHHWRQPLSTISTLAGNLQIRLDLEQFHKDDFSHSLAEINDHAQFLSNTISDFKSFFNPKKSRKSVDLNGLLDQVCRIMDAALQEAGITVAKEYAFAQELTTYPSELVQVLMNILINAKEVLLRRQIQQPLVRIQGVEEADRILILVTDNAGGIASDDLPKIFEPYFTTKHAHRGTGLGLYMAQSIIEKHCQGHIEARNLDQGAQFRVILPKVLAPEPSSPPMEIPHV